MWASQHTPWGAAKRQNLHITGGNLKKKILEGGKPKLAHIAGG
jgi:hypothetical protein